MGFLDSIIGGGQGLLSGVLGPYDPNENPQPRAWTQLFTDPFGQRVPIPSMGQLWDRSQQNQRMNAQPSTNLADYAGLADAFGTNSPSLGTNSPALVNVPLPRPRPDMMPPQSAPAAGISPPTDISAQSVNMQQAPSAPQVAPSQAVTGFNPLERLQAAGAGFFNAGSPMQAIGNVVGGLATGQRQDYAGQVQANQAQTAQALYGALVQRGMSQTQAMAVAKAAATDPKMAETLLPQALGLKPPATMEGVLAERAHNQGRGGQSGAPGPQVTAPSTPMAQFEDFTRRKAAAEKAGTTEGERVANAQLDLKPAVAQANEALRLAGELRQHKGRDNPIFFHSKSSAYLPDSAIPGNTDARDAVTILNQLKGGAFLEAFKALKGGGAITEVEGKKATDAIARMDRSQSRAEFDKALSDYEGIVKLGVDRANQLAGQPAPNNFQGNAMKPGNYDWTPGSGLKQRK